MIYARVGIEHVQTAVDGETPVRFLGVFFGGNDVPNVLHPPQSH